MTMLIKSVLLVPGLIVILAYLVYEPLPNYVEDRYTVALKMGTDKICRYIASVAKYTGLWDAPHVVICRAANAAQNLLLAHTGSPLPSNSSRLTILPAQFARSRALVYRPAGARPGGPALVWIHGGGWIFDSPEVYGAFTARFAVETNITVVSIAYRLAPEHPFPAAFDDCVDAVRAILKSSDSSLLDVNPHRVMIGGDSAGGQLAAAVAQLLAGPSEPRSPRMQLLIYPITQMANFLTQSHRESFRSPLLTGRMVAEAAALYLNGSLAGWRTILGNGHASKSVRTVYAKHIGESLPPPEPPVVTDAAYAARLERLLVDPRVSPLLAPTLDPLRLPPAYIVACQHDPLRSDAHMYSQRLERSGVRVYYKYYPCYHGCLTGQADAKRIVDDLAMFFNSNALL